MGDLARDLHLEGSAGRYRGVVSPEWVVWTPNGGFIASLALRAAGLESPGHRPVSLSCHYLNVPALEEASIEVTTLRASRRARSMRVSMTQGSKHILEALIWTGTGDGDGLEHDVARMPTVAPPEEIVPWTPLDGEERDGVLPIWRNIDARLEGWPPGQRWEERTPGPPLRHEWCRFRPRATFDDPFVDAARAVILIDTLMFPAAAMTYGEPMTHFAPSLDLSVWFHRAATEHEWLLCEAASPLAETGLVAGTARVWAPDGRLVASGGQQMISTRIPSMFATAAREDARA